MGLVSFAPCSGKKGKKGLNIFHMPTEDSLFRRFVRSQIWLSHRFDALLPEKFSTAGYRDFKRNLAKKYLTPEITLYDLGGGKRPYLDLKTKEKLSIHLVGVDADSGELSAAPAGLYDEAICADLTQYRGRGDADIVLCMAVLEHVQNTEQAMMAIFSALKPGGKALLYLPSGKAIFARMNRVLPESFKRRLLRLFFPSDHNGFPAYYDRCTPAEFRTLVRKQGFNIIEERLYFASYYFAFLFPLHLLWRTMHFAYYVLAKESAAESFSLVLEKPLVTRNTENEKTSSPSHQLCHAP